MSTISPFIRMTLQALNENVDTWGNVLNVSALELLEDAIAGTGEVSVTTGNVTLDDTAGGPSENGPSPAPSARFAILNVTGSPGGTNDVITPARSKMYLVANNTGDSSSVRIIPTGMGATGVTIPSGEAQFVYCDGTNMIAATAANATNATNATTATNSTQLVGVAGGNYALKTAAQAYTAGQVVTRAAVTTTAGSLTIDCADSNAFYLLTTESLTLQAPINATNGQQFSLIIEQGGGGPHTIGFAANTFAFAGGNAPVLSTVAGQTDYLAFEYVTNLSGGARWVGSIISDVSDV